jgi:disulfide bond formation protein DsbB
MRVRSISHAPTAWLVVGISWTAVALALVSQHRYGFEPCPWCVVQRVAYLLVGLFALCATFVRQSRAAASAWLGLASLAALGGLAAALHQHFVAAQTSSCAFTAADRWIAFSRLDELLPAVFKATAACDEANAPLLGVPYALWSAAVAVGLLGLLLRAFAATRIRR